MSRIGRQPIDVPTTVKLDITDTSVTATGPKGELTTKVMPGLSAALDGQVLTVTKVLDNDDTQRTFGLQRTLINNIVVGVSQGYERKLEINGVGFRASVAGTTLNMTLGFSHPVVFALPTGVEAKVERNVITLTGADKQQVGQVAANIRSLKKPEPYKGKGIKYAEEHIRRKAGKAASK